MASEVLTPYYGVNYSYVCDGSHGKCLPIFFSTLGFLVSETIAITEAAFYRNHTFPFTLACIASGVIIVIYGTVLFIQIRQKGPLSQINP